MAKAEKKAYLFSLFKDRHGCHIIELVEQESPPQQQRGKVKLDVCLRVSDGYTGREVAEAYYKVDRKRRDIYAGLGKPVRKRRRQSQTLMKAESLSSY